jgi:putative hydrolase of the HAD superfamily
LLDYNIFMSKAIIYDADGMVILPPKMFSEHLAALQKVSQDVVDEFFIKDFKPCLLGQADLKENLKPYIKKWHWDKSVDDLLSLWFSYENVVNIPLLDNIHQLRGQGVMCVLATNQEKYRYGYMTRRMQIQQHFDAIYVSCDLGSLKPEVEFFDTLFADLQTKGITEKSDILFWDDRSIYVDAASYYGFDAHQYVSYPMYYRVIANQAV